MKFICCGENPPYHRIAFRRRRSRRVAHTKCGIELGTADTIVVIKNPEPPITSCHNCLEVIARANAKKRRR